MLAAAMALGAAPAAAEGSLGCGSLAPFGTSCQDCCAPLAEEPRVSSQLLGFVGALEMRLATTQGALAWRCTAAALDGAEVASGVVLPSSEECTGPSAEGKPPRAGELVQLRCRALPLAEPLSPQGPWGCRAEG